mmetsp:Transcript_6259/g.20571  ORF Transcript_6259/g.20571 Transcript_6259/m.20571 type:complete len:735 (+) Transcript_6259:815-3019(+)
MRCSVACMRHSPGIHLREGSTTSSSSTADSASLASAVSEPSLPPILEADLDASVLVSLLPREMRADIRMASKSLPSPASARAVASVASTKRVRRAVSALCKWYSRSPRTRKEAMRASSSSISLMHRHVSSPVSLPSAPRCGRSRIRSRLRSAPSCCPSTGPPSTMYSRLSRSSPMGSCLSLPMRPASTMKSSSSCLRSSSLRIRIWSRSPRRTCAAALLACSERLRFPSASRRWLPAPPAPSSPSCASAPSSSPPTTEPPPGESLALERSAAPSTVQGSVSAPRSAGDARQPPVDAASPASEPDGGPARSDIDSTAASEVSALASPPPFSPSSSPAASASAPASPILAAAAPASILLLTSSGSSAAGLPLPAPLLQVEARALGAASRAPARSCERRSGRSMLYLAASFACSSASIWAFRFLYSVRFRSCSLSCTLADASKNLEQSDVSESSCTTHSVMRHRVSTHNDAYSSAFSRASMTDDHSDASPIRLIISPSSSSAWAIAGASAPSVAAAEDELTFLLTMEGAADQTETEWPPPSAADAAKATEADPWPDVIMALRATARFFGACATERASRTMRRSSGHVCGHRVPPWSSRRDASPNRAQKSAPAVILLGSSRSTSRRWTDRRCSACTITEDSPPGAAANMASQSDQLDNCTTRSIWRTSADKSSITAPFFFFLLAAAALAASPPRACLAGSNNAISAGGGGGGSPDSPSSRWRTVARTSSIVAAGTMAL